ncbi:MAG TPA: hypothetical protein VHT34_12010 [Clostridia bacterium]|nr:hypothetical protein [Clostridia bacterium]
MNDKKLEILMGSLEGSTAPDGLKEKILQNVLDWDFGTELIQLTPFQKMFFVNPLRAASIMAVAFSGTLWAALGNNYTSLISGLVGVR